MPNTCSMKTTTTSTNYANSTAAQMHNGEAAIIKNTHNNKITINNAFEQIKTSENNAIYNKQNHQA